jgi:hypothetical protein
MNDYDPTSPHETLSARPVSTATSGPPPVTMVMQQRRPTIRRLLSSRSSRWITAAALMSTMIGLSACGTSSGTAAGSGSAGALGSGGGGSNARSGPAAGGASGTVASVSTSGFTMSTSAGQTVTVDEASSTKYQNGTSSTSASAITTGEGVLVLGTTSGTTITATQVIVQPTGGVSAPPSAAGVIPFQRGAPTTSKQVGQIPANYSQGSGTIVSGTTANMATEAALAAYPGGVVDRVVQLSDGEYEVHYIGVNWPHHIFVNQDFKVVGAD